jgi:hypothetical protein
MMPSTSKKQHNFMAAVAHNPAFAKKAGVPQSVGKDFNDADKGRKFGSGGVSRADVQKVNKPKTQHGKMALFKEGGDTMATKMKKMNMGGYADGGMTMVNKGGKMVPNFAADGVGKMKKGGMAKADMKQDKGMMQKAVNKHEGRLHKGAAMTKLSKGGMAPSKMGSVKNSATRDGVAVKGKTKGTMITMKRGGKC